MKRIEQERFVKGATALVERFGGVPDGDRWTMETKYGKLSLRVVGDCGDSGTVFTRFDDAKRAHPDTCCNPHSGKWNHHYFDPWTVKQALIDLEYQLKRVMQ